MISWLGRESLPINAYLRTKLKVSVFENGQFSRHLIFDKKKFVLEKKIVYDKQELCFLKKKTFSFFLKKNVFFWKICFQNFQNFSAHTKFIKIFLNFFSKTFPKKTFFLKKKRKMFFFSKKKQSSCLSRYNIFFLQNKNCFCQKSSVR